MTDARMKVLVACEFSGRVRQAFRDLGHDAWSCDLLPSEDDSAHHIHGDVGAVLHDGWDIVIAHPPCTYLTGAAEWAYADPDFERFPGVGYHQRVQPGTLTGAARRAARIEAIAFALTIWRCPAPRVCIENPVGVLSRELRSPCIVQPYEFGDDASKKTCLFLRGLPWLVPTDHVAPRMVNGKPRWANQTDTGQNRLSPGADRWKERSRTYQGIALAMARQWSDKLRPIPQALSKPAR
jgi:hypothetical protein